MSFLVLPGLSLLPGVSGVVGRVDLTISAPLARGIGGFFLISGEELKLSAALNLLANRFDNLDLDLLVYTCLKRKVELFVDSQKCLAEITQSFNILFK